MHECLPWTLDCPVMVKTCKLVLLILHATVQSDLETQGQCETHTMFCQNRTNWKTVRTVAH